MWADAHAARRCLRYAQTCFAAALELPKVFSKSKSNAKAAAKGEGAKRLSHKQDRRACEAGLSVAKTATRCASVRRERARAVSKTEGLATRASALSAVF